jgi:hypothetical protein
MTKALDETLKFLQSASNAVAGNVSGPVDLISMALNKLGIPVKAPVGGSDWMRQQGLTADVQQGAAQVAGDTFGLLAPTMAVAKAPQIAKGLLQMGDNLAAPRTLNPQTGAIVWHGSPHKFDKFDSSKIGTGEGAQAYGHGLYLAENPGVARDYRNKLSQNITTADANFGDKTLHDAASSFGTTGYPLAFAKKYFDLLKSGKTEAQAKAQILRQLQKRVEKALFPGDVKGAKEAIEFLKSGKAELSGSLYKVDLPDDQIAKMLDWDKPLGQQRGVMDALYDSGLAKGGWASGTSGERRFIQPAKADRTGAALLEDLKTLMGQTKAEEALRNAGIPGIRYLDGVSRGAGQGTSNFVVFPGNEGLLTILERNGQALR